MNYTELKDYIEAATENVFDATDFAVMTRVAETKVYNSVQLPSTRKNSTAALVIGSKYLSCPTDMNSVFSFAVAQRASAPRPIAMSKAAIMIDARLRPCS